MYSDELGGGGEGGEGGGGGGGGVCVCWGGGEVLRLSLELSRGGEATKIEQLRTKEEWV